MTQQSGTNPKGTAEHGDGMLVVGQEKVLPIIEERLDIRKVAAETGAVRVRKIVHEETRTVDMALMREEVNITRVPVNKEVEAKFHSRQEGNTLVIPIFKEVITRHLMLIEEVRVTTRRIPESTTEEVTLKREEAVVERYDEVSGTWKPDTSQ